MLLPAAAHSVLAHHAFAPLASSPPLAALARHGPRLLEHLGPDLAGLPLRRSVRQ